MQGIVTAFGFTSGVILELLEVKAMDSQAILGGEGGLLICCLP